jgi:hypothetical protein
MEEARYRALFLAMFMLVLMIGGNCSYLRATSAHLVGHLPAIAAKRLVTLALRGLDPCATEVFGCSLPALPALAGAGETFAL